MRAKEIRVQLIAIGDEVLIGQVKDTNTYWLAKQLSQLSISVEDTIPKSV